MPFLCDFRDNNRAIAGFCPTGRNTKLEGNHHPETFQTFWKAYFAATRCVFDCSQTTRMIGSASFARLRAQLGLKKILVRYPPCAVISFYARDMSSECSEKLISQPQDVYLTAVKKLEIVDNIHLATVLSFDTDSYSPGLELVLHDKVLESLRSKNIIKFASYFIDFCIMDFHESPGDDQPCTWSRPNLVSPKNKSWLEAREFRRLASLRSKN